ncbi:MAG: DUF423 domain-containing protein [Salinisphaeraceae bacterium]|nr:DUF423 domain-containing protein [Salinisphaeraceae bacterium]
MTAKFCLLIGSMGGLLGVVLGAFGSHGLKARLSADMLAVWQTAVEYQFYHSLALIGVGLLLMQQSQASLAGWAGLAFAIGIVLFSGSLYVLALSGIKPLGAITPIGGLSFIVGWVLLIAAVLKLA